MKVMKTLSSLMVMIVMMQTTFAQEAGIQFTTGKNWTEVLAKAAKEQKCVFVDCFTTWCGPCKYMSKEVFTKEDVGTFFNANLLSISLQLDTTKNDDELVKKQYADAAMLAKKYQVRAYPTFLFFSPNGELLHKSLGASDVNSFLAMSQRAINVDSAFYPLKEQFEKGTLKSSRQLYLLAMDAAMLNDESLNEYALKYIKTQKNLFTDANIQLLYSTTKHLSDTGLKIIASNEKAFDAKTKKGTANDLVVKLLYNDVSNEIDAAAAQSGQEPNWVAMEKKFSVRFPKHSKLAILFSKTIYYNIAQKLDKKINAAFEYCSLSPSPFDAGALNEWAMSVYSTSTNQALLNKALFLSKKSLEEGEVAEMLDTYACILYKLGRTKEAIEWETKALAKAKDDIDYYKKTIDQMKKGVKIWENPQ